LRRTAVSEVTEAKKPEAKQKKPIQILRERLGGVPREVVQRNKTYAAARRQLRAALEKGAKIVPELAEETGLPTQQLFWLLMGMKKYGTVAEGDERDGYYEYRLITESKQE